MTIVIVYVDDFFITAQSVSLRDSVINSLRTKYNSINVSYGPSIEYLGMNLDFSTKKQVTITMTNKIKTYSTHTQSPHLLRPLRLINSSKFANSLS
jgi:hypothetical protein